MYRLSSSDSNNDHSIDNIFKKAEMSDKIRETATFEKIAYLIFNDQIDEKLYNILSLSLTLGDEIYIPIHKKVVDVLYFSLLVNYNNKFRIRNLSQAMTLYELYENDYKLVEIEDDSRINRTTSLLANHSAFMEDFHVEWKIPVGFFKSKDKSFVTLAGTEYCLLKVHEEEYKIPRLIFIKFFRESLIKGRLIVNSTDELKAKFDLNNYDALIETLNYIGYYVNPKYKNIELIGEYNFIEDGIIYTVGQVELNSDIWVTQQGGIRHSLLPKLEYIAIRSGQNSISLMTNYSF